MATPNTRVSAVWHSAKRWLALPALVMLLAVVFARPAPAQAPRPGSGASAEQQRITPRGDPRSSLPMPIFEFHSGFWLNLHHVLYAEARLRDGRPTRRPAVKSSGGFEAALRVEEKAEWERAVAYYASEFVTRDLIFDGDLVAVKARLAELENCPDLSGHTTSECRSGLVAGHIAALEAAAPVYRAHLWPEHDRRNRAWIAALVPLVERHGTAPAKHLSLLYNTDWPAQPMRVDVSAYAGAIGGYATLDPLHVTISSLDERNAGPAALEALFFTASYAIAGNVRSFITRECRARGKPIPRDLWNALLYFSAADISRRAPDDVARPAAPPTAGAALEARNFQTYRGLIEVYWRPLLMKHLRGEADVEDLERAVTRLVSAL